MDQQQRVAVRPLDVVEDEQDRSVGRRAAHEVGDGFEEQASARLRVLGFGERQPAHSRGQVRRQAPDLTAMPRDVVGQHRHRRAADVLTDRLSERFVRSGDELVTRPEEHCPVVAVRDAGDRRRDARLARAGLASEEHGLDRAAGSAVARGVDCLGEVAAADEHTGERGRQRDRERRRRRWHVARCPRRQPGPVVVDELVDRLDLLGASKQLAAEELQLGSVGQLRLDQRRRRRAEQHLPTVRERTHARSTVHRLPVVVPAALEGLTGVDAHTHRDRRRVVPLLCGEQALCLGGRGGRRDRAGEHGERAVSFSLVLEEHPAVSLDRRRDECVVAGERSVHGHRRALPERGRIDHVGEQEAQHTAR